MVMIAPEKGTDTYYRTTDLFLGAALLSSGISFVKTEVGDNPNYLTFVFEEKEKCAALEKKWWSGLLFVSGLRFAEANKHLKRILRKDKERLLQELG